MAGYQPEGRVKAFTGGVSGGNGTYSPTAAPSYDPAAAGMQGTLFSLPTQNAKSPGTFAVENYSAYALRNVIGGRAPGQSPGTSYMNA